MAVHLFSLHTTSDISSVRIFRTSERSFSCFLFVCVFFQYAIDVVMCYCVVTHGSGIVDHAHDSVDSIGCLERDFQKQIVAKNRTLFEDLFVDYRQYFVGVVRRLHSRHDKIQLRS